MRGFSTPRAATSSDSFCRLTTRPLKPGFSNTSCRWGWSRSAGGRAFGRSCRGFQERWGFSARRVTWGSWRWRIRAGIRCGRANSASSAPLAARAEAVDAFERGRYLGSLLIGQLRPPDVEQQDDTQLGAVIPGFVLDAVVKDDQLALARGTGLVTDPQPTVAGDDQGQVADQPDVGVTVVRWDTRARSQRREYDRRCSPFDPT